MKIVLLGSAPASVRLAPYSDPSWKIWGCSPGVYPVAERLDVFFELHRMEWPVLGRADKQVPWLSPEYCAWLAAFKGPVYMAEVESLIPPSVRYPRESMLSKYGPYFFTSSLAWMFALALEQSGLDEIGLWGVDMSATEEYGYQRAGCHYFVTLAKQRGIKVTVPGESDLLQPPPLYGIGETSPMAVKLTARMKELQIRHNNANAACENGVKEVMFLKGAIDDLNYMINTWTNQEEAERFLKGTELQLADVLLMKK